MIIDTREYAYFWVAVDKNYVYSYSPNYEDSSLGIKTSFWGYGELDLLPYKYTYTNFHSASTMEFGLIGFWTRDETNIWMRELNVTFFGCYEACATCWEDNSPVHCTSCLDGYFLVGTECKACSPICSTCLGTADNCKSCPSGEFLKGTACFATCGLGFFPDALDNNNCKPCPT